MEIALFLSNHLQTLRYPQRYCPRCRIQSFDLQSQPWMPARL